MKKTGIKRMRVKFVIFDWSGTISDDLVACYRTAMKLYRHFGIAEIPLKRWQAGTLATVIDGIRSNGIKEDAKKVLELYSRLYAETINEHRPRPFADAADTLSFLKSKEKKIVVVSGHPHEHLVKEISDYGFDRFISSAFGSTKNKAERLRQLVTEFGVEPSEVVYVGDMVWDVRAAKEAGILSAAILRGYHSEDALIGEHPDIAVHSLEELKDAID